MPLEALRGRSCLLHCADSEPFGLVVLEALASARPVVAPAVGGPAELLDDEVGRLYPPGDAAAAADRLVEVLGDPELAARLGAAARRRAEERHGLADAGARWREAVGSAPGSRRPPARGSRSSPSRTTPSASWTALLRSVERHLSRWRSVVVVDSGSSDGSVAVARAVRRARRP